MTRALIEDALRRIGEGEDAAMDLAGTALTHASARSRMTWHHS